MSFLNPKEIISKIIDIGEAKSHLSAKSLLILGMLAGIYIGFAAHLATTIATGECAYFGLKKLLIGAVFSVGLMLVIIPGAELFTGNNLMTAALYKRKITTMQMLRNWTWVYVANFIGSIILAFLIARTTGLLSGEVGGTAIRIAYGKVAGSSADLNHWWAYFTRGILCNWLVCLAVMMAISATSINGKVWAIFFPIMAFVAAGFEHSVANMYFIPAGIFATHFQTAVDASGLSAEALSNLNWTTMWTQNLIPVTLGNIVGGGFFTGTVYAYLHREN